MNTNEKGNVGLANVIADAVNKGYFIFMPFSDTTCVDLIIANKKMITKRAQVKYISENKDGLMIISTSTVINGKKTPVDLTKIDFWAVYCPDTKLLYYVNVRDLIGKSVISLRIREPKQIQRGIKYANEYLNLDNIWND